MGVKRLKECKYSKLNKNCSPVTDAIINITGGSNLTLFEAEQAAEVVRAAANTDINTIFGSVINENLTDEVIVTVIATGFDKKNKKQPLYNQMNQPEKRQVNYVDDDDDDTSGGFDAQEIEIPTFMHRNF